MAFLKVIFPHKRDGKFLSSASYYEVPDDQVERLLGVDPVLGVKLFCLEDTSWKVSAKAPEEFFQEANQAVDEARQKIAEDSLDEELAKAEIVVKPATEDLEDAPKSEEPAEQLEVEAAVEEAVPTQTRASRRKARNQEQE